MFEQMLVAQETEGDDEFVIVEEEESSSFVTPLRASKAARGLFPERRDNFLCAEGIGAIYCQIASKREMMQDHLEV